MADKCLLCSGEHCAVHHDCPCDCDTADRHAGRECGRDARLKQVATEYEELVRITREFLAQQFGVFSGYKYDDLARTLLARYLHSGYVWKKINE